MSLHEGRALSPANQLELWGDDPGSEQGEGLRVVRRDGRESPFDVSILTNSILRAGWPGESLDPDTVSSLSQAVQLYLQHSHVQPVSVATLRETVERLLLDMGYSLTARMYAGAFAPSPAADAGMFDEALTEDRAERLLAAAAAEAGLDRGSAEDLVAAILRQIAAAGVKELTPGLLREWIRAELRARGLLSAASKLARISIPVSALYDVFAESEDTPLIAPADPAAAALALAGRVSSAYVLGQLVPAAVAQAHVRGDIQVRGVGNFMRLDSIAMDLEGLKESGPLGSSSWYASAKNPQSLAAQIRAHSDTLGRFFGGEISWSAVNFGLAPYLSGCSDDDVREVVRHVLDEVFTRALRSDERSGLAELQLSWDAPDDFPEELAGPVGARVALPDCYSEARRFLGAMLSEIAQLSEEGRAHGALRLSVDLSPYFFGAPEADRYLDTIGRIAKGTAPITLRYTPAAPLMFGDSATRRPADVVAQTVSIFAARAAKLSSSLKVFLERLETAVDTAVAAHRAKRDFIKRVMDQRNGPLALLQRSYAGNTLAPLDAMHYRIAVSGLTHSALVRADVPWMPSGDELAIAEAALDRIKQCCERWTTATGQRFVLTGTDAPRMSERARLRPEKTVALETHLHPLYDVAPHYPVNGEAFASSSDVAQFSRYAFLNTSCRALRFV